jgi:hypothetical protein
LYIKVEEVFNEKGNTWGIGTSFGYGSLSFHDYRLFKIEELGHWD